MNILDRAVSAWWRHRLATHLAVVFGTTILAAMLIMIAYVNNKTVDIVENASQTLFDHAIGQSRSEIDKSFSRIDPMLQMLAADPQEADFHGASQPVFIQRMSLALNVSPFTSTIYTGFDELLLSMDRQPDRKKLHSVGTGLDGGDPKLQQWITDSGLVALAADNTAVESLPSARTAPGPRPLMPLHAHCLFKLGVHLGELWYLTELATWLRTQRRNRFLLTAPPLRLPGAVGSPATPIATV